MTVKRLCHEPAVCRECQQNLARHEIQCWQGCRPDVEVGQSQRQADMEQEQICWQLSKRIHQLHATSQPVNVAQTAMLLLRGMQHQQGAAARCWYDDAEESA